MSAALLIDGYTVDRVIPRAPERELARLDDARRRRLWPAPERTRVQRMNALQRANEIRTKRAALKRDLKAGRASIHSLLLEPPYYVETAKVLEVLLAVPKIGRVKGNKILQVARISPSKTVGGLSARQRAELVSMLGR